MGIVRDNESIKCICTIVSYAYYREALYDQPLGFRAWALQERLLPQRVLSFGLGELFWDCVQLPNASESFPYGLPKYPGLSDMLGLTDKTIPKTKDDRRLRSVWFRILEEYTDRELIYPEADKLVALSAVAVRMKNAMNDVYIAGHFWKTLPDSLNWQVQPPVGRSKRRKRAARRITRLVKEDTGERHEKAPSWSWPSMDGPLYMYNVADHSHRHNSLADTQAYKLDSIDEMNPTGQIVSASLQIRAYCAEMEWGQPYPTSIGKPKKWNDDAYNFKANIDDPDDTPTEGTRFLIAVLVENICEGRWEGLILQEVEERTYKRVGHYLLYDSQRQFQKPSWREYFKLVFGREKRTLTLV